MPEQKTGDLPIILFINQRTFEAWLEDHPRDEKGVWVKLARKGSDATSIDYAAAVESALCFGWIDSLSASYDQQYYLQKFTPRTAKSRWSKLNTEKAEALIAAGRMQPSGYRQVELAKADGRWETAYDPQSQITIPEDFQAAMDDNPQANEFFSTLNGSNRYAILHRIQIARKPENRSARIQKFIEMLAANEKIYP
jgi:uncharacterized protein YdeI (YjbR/CyaY-like superfamily)